MKTTLHTFKLSTSALSLWIHIVASIAYGAETNQGVQQDEASSLSKPAGQDKNDTTRDPLNNVNTTLSTLKPNQPALRLSDADIADLEVNTVRQLDRAVADSCIKLAAKPEIERSTLEYYLAYERLAADYEYARGAQLWEEVNGKLTDRVVWPEPPTKEAVSAYQDYLEKQQRQKLEAEERKRLLLKEAEDRALKMKEMQLEQARLETEQAQVQKMEEQNALLERQLLALQAAARNQEAIKNNQESMERYIKYGRW